MSTQGRLAVTFLPVIVLMAFACGHSGPSPSDVDAIERDVRQDEQSSEVDPFLGSLEGMVVIEGGEFIMGCDSSTKGSYCFHHKNTPTSHIESVIEFAVDMTEVSVYDYRLCVGDLSCEIPRVFDLDTIGIGPRKTTWIEDNSDLLPINNITKTNAESFCRWKGGRLCSEAEWERACRGADGFSFPWGNEDYGCLKLHLPCMIDVYAYAGTVIYDLPECDNCGEIGSVNDPREDISPDGVTFMAGNGWEMVSEFSGDPGVPWPRTWLKGGECYYRRWSADYGYDQMHMFRCCCTPTDEGSHCAATSADGVSQTRCRPGVRRRVEAPGGMQFVHCGSISMSCWHWTQEGDELIPCERAQEHNLPAVAFVESYWIDTNEVSAEALLACVEEGPCSLGAEPTPPANIELQCPSDRKAYLAEQEAGFPATCVTQAEAQKYCKWKGKRLCTEAEFERAGRGVDHRLFPWGNRSPTCEQASFRDCGSGAPVKAGALVGGISPFGVLELSGNVAEYVSSPYMDFWTAANGTEDGPPYLFSNTDFVDRYDPLWELYPDGISIVRGGSFADSWELLRLTLRTPQLKTTASKDVGFRCCLSD